MRFSYIHSSVLLTIYVQFEKESYSESEKGEQRIMCNKHICIIINVYYVGYFGEKLGIITLG